MYKQAKTIAFIGIRGIPFTYSGFEEFALQLSLSLAQKKCNVLVYCRDKYFPNHKKIHTNIKQYYLPSIYHPALETITHSFISTLHACFYTKPDSILYFGIGSTVWSFIPRLFGIPTIVNVDGLDWKRQKWSFSGRIFLHFSEILATFFPSGIITDSRFMQAYFKKYYRKESVYIPYYFNPSFYQPVTQFKKLADKFKINQQKYFLWVGRLVPDNNLDEVIKAYVTTKSSLKLIIVGSDLYQTKYKDKIQDRYQSHKSIVFTGFLSQKDLIPLYESAHAYVESKRSSGTHPSLIEALELSNSIIANDAPATKQILRTSAYFYKSGDSKDLSKAMLDSLTFKQNKVSMRDIVKNNYSSKKIMREYEKLFSIKN